MLGLRYNPSACFFKRLKIFLGRRLQRLLWWLEEAEEVDLQTRSPCFLSSRVSRIPVGLVLDIMNQTTSASEAQDIVYIYIIYI